MAYSHDRGVAQLDLSKELAQRAISITLTCPWNADAFPDLRLRRRHSRDGRRHSYRRDLEQPQHRVGKNGCSRPTFMEVRAYVPRQMRPSTLYAEFLL